MTVLHVLKVSWTRSFGCSLLLLFVVETLKGRYPKFLCPVNLISPDQLVVTSPLHRMFHHWPHAHSVGVVQKQQHRTESSDETILRTIYIHHGRTKKSTRSNRGEVSKSPQYANHPVGLPHIPLYGPAQGTHSLSPCYRVDEAIHGVFYLKARTIWTPYEVCMAITISLKDTLAYGKKISRIWPFQEGKKRPPVVPQRLTTSGVARTAPLLTWSKYRFILSFNGMRGLLDP